MAIVPKGYISYVNRKGCHSCKFYDFDINKPKQARKMLCLKVHPPMEVYEDDVCDEHEEPTIDK